MSLCPDSTVGTWNASPNPTGATTFGLRRRNSGSEKRLNGFPSTAPSQPIPLGGFARPHPEFWKLYDWVSNFVSWRWFSLRFLTGCPGTGLSTQHVTPTYDMATDAW